MRAIQITGPHAFGLSDVAIPTPGSDEALIRIAAVGLCGTDVELSHGTQPYYTSGRARFPVVPGHEWAGIVEQISPNAKGLRVGDQVVGECSLGCDNCAPCRAGAYHTCKNLREMGILNKDGAFAEFATAPVRALHPVPASIPAATAALVEPCAVALNGVRRTGLAPGAPLTVFGDGPIGLLAVLVARAVGAGQITMVGTQRARLDLAERFGAQICHADQVADLPPARHILEATGNPDAVTAALRTLGPGGTLALLGLFGGKPLENLPLDRLVIGDQTVTGVLGSPHLWPEVIDLIASGKLDPAPVITHRLSLEAFDQALGLAETKQAIKTVLVPDPRLR